MSGGLHTPGPWYVTEAAEDLGYCRIREQASDYVLATADDGGHVDPQFALPAEQIEANAHLIAAAPELYDAGAAILAALEGQTLGIRKEAMNSFAFALSSVQAALAKARGEQVPE